MNPAGSAQVRVAKTYSEPRVELALICVCSVLQIVAWRSWRRLTAVPTMLRCGISREELLTRRTRLGSKVKLSTWKARTSGRPSRAVTEVQRSDGQRALSDSERQQIRQVSTGASLAAWAPSYQTCPSARSSVRAAAVSRLPPTRIGQSAWSMTMQPVRPAIAYMARPPDRDKSARLQRWRRLTTR